MRPPRFPHPERLRGIEQPELLEAGESLPLGLLFLRGLDAVGGTAQGEGRDVFMDPPRKVSHGRLGSGDRGLGQALRLRLAALGRPRHLSPRQRLQKRLGHGLVLHPAVSMAIQLHVETQETDEIALLGVDRPLHLPRHLGAEVPLGQGHETHLRVPGPRGQNLMLKIIHGFEGLGWRHFPPFRPIISNRRAVLLQIPIAHVVSEGKLQLQGLLSSLLGEREGTRASRGYRRQHSHVMLTMRV
jgi:hypothetical protein